MYTYVFISYYQDGDYGDTYSNTVYAGQDAETGYKKSVKLLDKWTSVDCEVWLDGEYKFTVDVK